MDIHALARRDLLMAGLTLPLAGLAARAQAQTPAGAPGPEVGPFEIASVERMDLVDPDRGRTIVTRAYFPAKPGRYPVIIFSHGFGGSSVIFPNTGKVWASHGYVVLHPTHSDSLAMMDANVPSADAAVMRKFRAMRGAVDRETQMAFVKVLDDPFFLTSRLHDVGFLLNALKTPKAGLDAQVLARADTSKIGMSGHSFGGYTTIVLAGSTLVPPPGAPVPTGFAGFLCMSGQGAGRMSLNTDSFRTIVKPFMATTGTRDFGAANETPPWRLQPWELSPPGRKYAVVVEGFRHADFDPTPGDPEVGARSAELRKLQLQFWDSVLKSDRGAQDTLAKEAQVSKSTDPVWLRQR
jgi:pimeloyl-ACP methyl ester carboxylesterase